EVEVELGIDNRIRHPLQRLTHGDIQLDGPGFEHERRVVETCGDDVALDDVLELADLFVDHLDELTELRLGKDVEPLRDDLGESEDRGQGRPHFMGDGGDELLTGLLHPEQSSAAFPDHSAHDDEEEQAESPAGHGLFVPVAVSNGVRGPIKSPATAPVTAPARRPPTRAATTMGRYITWGMAVRVPPDQRTTSHPAMRAAPIAPNHQTGCMRRTAGNECNFTVMSSAVAYRRLTHPVAPRPCPRSLRP